MRCVGAGMATIKEIASRAGVSTSTVSHVINRTRFVSDDAKRRVTKAIEELDYVPNAVAQSLRRNTTLTLGMMVPNNTNPFFAEVMRGVEDECFRQGYSLILCNSDDDPRKQGSYLRVMMRKRIDGLVLLSSGSNEHLYALLSTAPVPVVLVDREIEGIPADFVQVDHERGGYLGGLHLTGLGHRCIAVIVGPTDLAVNAQRLAGFRRILDETNTPLDPDLIIATDFTSKGGYEAMRLIIEMGRHPTAVFADNDLIAIGVICAAEEAGLRIPEDLSVVGFDDIALAAYTNPPLTTVRQPKHEIGTTTAQLLIERIADPGRPFQRVILEPEFCLRKTTAPPAQKTN